MEVNVDGIYYQIPELNRLKMIKYGFREIVEHIKDWWELITLTRIEGSIRPYRFELMYIRDCFWENIAFQTTDHYFLQVHKIAHMKKIKREKTGIKITIFDLISRNCFKKHPDIKHHFWRLIIEGWHVFLFNFSRWYMLIQMGDGTDGYPGYEWKMPLSRNLFFNLMARTMQPENLIIPYNNKLKNIDVWKDRVEE